MFVEDVSSEDAGDSHYSFVLACVSEHLEFLQCFCVVFSVFSSEGELGIGDGVCFDSSADAQYVFGVFFESSVV